MKKILFVLLLILLFAPMRGWWTSVRDLWVEFRKPNIEAVTYQQVQQDQVELSSTDVPPSTEVTGDETGGEEVKEPTETEEAPGTPVAPVSNESNSSDIPTRFNLAIPFTSQAPHSNWDEVHEETCEEAASLMAAYFLQGKPAGKMNVDEAEAQLQQIVAYENAFFGYYKDTTAAETALLVETYFHLTAEVVQNPTVADLKQFVSSGYPVLVPTAGRQLGNPNFTPPGPPYHMVVLKGYTEDAFITNDPGTRLGADYTYDQNVFMNAIHDWNGGDVENGAKVVVVVKP